MNLVDFVKPNGTKVMRTIADYRQLNDALFHAGLRSGSQFEWEDTPNRLHFYRRVRRCDGDRHGRIRERSDQDGKRHRHDSMTRPAEIVRLSGSAVAAA